MLLKYFSEIQNRILLVCFSWSFTLIVTYLNKKVLLFLCIKPLLLLFKNNSFYFITTNLTDIFSAYFDLIYLIAVSLTIIFSVYHFLIFFSPGLYLSEQKTIKFFSFVSIVLWLFNLKVLHHIILPVILHFFVNFQSFSLTNINIFLEARINDYLYLYTFVYSISIIVNQLLLFFFFVLNILEKRLKFVKNTRKLFYIICFVTATFLTPPDILSQICLAICFILIYELLIVTIILKSQYT